jgi:gliding motility-associated-like protein
LRATLLILVTLFSGLGLSAQKTNSGTEFWFGFMKNYTGNNNILRLYVSASVNSKVYIEVPLQNFKDSMIVPKDSVKIYTMSTNLAYISELDSVVKKAIRVTSDFPVTLAAMNLIYATTDASIVLPTVNIPQSSTFVIGNPNTSGLKSLALIVASQDSTRVRITPSATTFKNQPAGVPFQVNLMRGEMYQLAASTGQLTGSIIEVLTPTKVAVFAGNECSNWPCGACDHQYEQIMPNLLVDTSYFVPPNFGHTNGYLLKLVPLINNSTIQVNGVNYSGITRTNPLVIDVKGDSGYYVRSTNPFHTFQFLKGANCNGYITSSYGDPAMVEILSTRYFGNSAMFSTVNSSNLKDHFVSIVIETSSKNTVYFDKTLIPSNEFIEFPFNKKYSYAALKITDGQHLIESTNGFLAYCYGIGYAESYFYLAGFNLPNFDLNMKDSVVNYNCKDGEILKQFKAESENILKSYTWYFGDNSTGSGRIINHVYSKTGVYTVKLIAEDFNGKKDSVIRTINVNWPTFDPVRNKIICGIDTVLFIEKNPFFTNFKWQDSSFQNNYRSFSTENIWVIATDTTGYCHFIDTGVVGKIDVFTDLKVDTIDNCHKFNLFKFSDSTKIVSDQIEHKAWVFPWTTVWDQNIVDIHFPMPGNYKVYFDVYTKQVNCKARYPISILVHPNPKAFTNLKGEDRCSNVPILFKDSSQIVTGRIDKVKWLFDDNTEIISDSFKTYKALTYSPSVGAVTRFYTQVPYSEYKCTDTVISAVNVWAKPIVNFDLISADTIKCLPSARWTFTSTTKSDLDTFSLVWDAGNGTTGTRNDLRNVRYLSSGKYKVKLKALSPFGCHDSITKTIEVIDVPKARFNILDSVQCLIGNSFTFKDSSSGQKLNKNWYFGNNQKDTGSMVDSVQFNSTGVQPVKLVVNSSIPGCIDSITKNVHILKHPEASFTINKDTQCFTGHSFNFINTSQFSQNKLKSEWTFVGKNNVNFLNNFDALNQVFNDSGNIQVYLTVTDDQLCASSDTGTVVLVTINQIELKVNDSIQCQDLNEFIIKTGKTDNSQKTWKVNGKIVQESEIDSLIFTNNKSGYYNISLLRENKGGCSDSSSLRVKIPQKVYADFRINDETQCFNGHSFDFTDIMNRPDDNISNFWYTVNDTFTSIDSEIFNFKFADSGTFKVKLKIKTVENCYDSVFYFVTVFPQPEAIVLGDEVCLGKTAELTATQISGNPIVEYNWELGDQDIATGDKVYHNYQSAGSYNLRVTYKDINDCEGETILNNGVVIRPLPDANFNYSITNYGFNQSIVRMQATQGYTRYNWNFPNGSSSNIDTAYLIVKDLIKGYINLKVYNQYGCSDSSERYIDHFPNNFNIYIPNAVSFNRDLLNDEFKIIGLGANRDFSMNIYNRWGEQVFYTQNPEEAWNGEYMGIVVPEGVYTYLIKFTFLDGKEYVYRGTLTVLR